MIVTIRDHVPGFSIVGWKITEDGCTMVVHLDLPDVERARATVSDDFGNVVLAIDAGNGDELVIVQSHDLEWV